MKLLLTSAGIKNTSIENALVELLGKPIADSDALCIPTATYGHPMPILAGHGGSSADRNPAPHVRTGLEVLGVLELTALPSIDEERWVPWVRETDVLLVNGGDALYLCHWMRQSGLADLLPSLPETVWVGLSAGSMVMTPRIGEDFVGWKPPTGGDSTLGIVDFSIFPHLDHELPAGQHHGRRRAMGGRHRGSGVRDRRRDRHQGERRHRRSRLRGALEAVHALGRAGAAPRPFRLPASCPRLRGSCSGWSGPCRKAS